MQSFITALEGVIGAVSNFIWQIFLPIFVVLGLYIGYKNLFVIKRQTTWKAGPIRFRQFIGPTSISLGGMVGTGAIIGVLGALNKYAAAGQHYVEALVFWTLIGCVIMLPLSYAETLFSKTMNRVPKSMIEKLLGRRFAAVYGLCFILLYVFGFGGFQFSGISNILSMISRHYLGVEIGVVQRYLFIVLPLVLLTSLIVMAKKHDVFVKAMTTMIGFAVFVYFIFFMVFISNTRDYLPLFFTNMLRDIQNPVTMAMGLPIGMILATQRIAQTSECAMGGLAMAAHENDSEPRTAAIISIIPVIMTIFVAIVVTTYMSSYGIYAGYIELPADDFTRLMGLFNTIFAVTGNFGLIVLAIFAVLSGASTLLSSYYYVQVLSPTRNESRNIAAFIIILICAGTLSTFGFSIIFDIVDLLIFVVSGIFVMTLFVYARRKWKDYRINL